MRRKERPKVKRKVESLSEEIIRQFGKEVLNQHETRQTQIDDRLLTTERGKENALGIIYSNLVSLLIPGSSPSPSLWTL